MRRTGMSLKTRRRFLEDSMFATAAALAASTVGRAAEKAEATKPKGPNEKYSVAIIGTGGRGSSHIGAFAGTAKTDITYLCDADLKRAEGHADKVAEKQGGKRPAVVQDMRKIFDDKSVDFISTATTNHWHSLC